MSRILNALNETDYIGNEANMLNIAYGGQQGYMPTLGIIGADGKPYRAWINNHAYVKRNIIPIVLQLPRFFGYMPDPQRLNEACVALFETHAETIDGLTSGLTVETDEHIVGAAGEMQQEVTKVTRARSEIKFTFREKAGKPINRFLDTWVRYGISDPDIQRPLVSILPSYDEKVYTPDHYSMTMIFIEPDFAHKNVVEAWLSTNMYPKSTGEITGKRDLSAGGEMVVYDVDMTSITLSNTGVKLLAQSIFDRLSVLNIDPDQVPLFVDENKEAAVVDAIHNFNADDQTYL